jgi:hypothetical protein
MTDIHTEYLKEDHFEDDDDEELNIEPQKSIQYNIQIISSKRNLLMSNYKRLSWRR